MKCTQCGFEYKVVQNQKTGTKFYLCKCPPLPQVPKIVTPQQPKKTQKSTEEFGKGL